jgi:hypothetical protein
LAFAVNAIVNALHSAVPFSLSNPGGQRTAPRYVHASFTHENPSELTLVAFSAN